MNINEETPDTHSVSITGLSMHQIKGIFEEKWGALMWYNGCAYPSEGVSLQFKKQDAQKEKTAPVQGYPQGIPWFLHLEAYAVYSKKWGPQPALIDLEVRNCRGGFSTEELDEFIPGWRDKVSDFRNLQTEIMRLKTVTDDMKMAVRWAPSSAYWSTVLVNIFGPNARDGINALEKQLREQIAVGTRQGMGVVLTHEERDAFKRFHETWEDDIGYDVPKEMMKHLAEIGVVHHITAGRYGITKFGHSVLAADETLESEGWQTAPIEPTDTMSEAGMNTFIRTSAHETEIDVDVIYRAMLAAAPKKQTQSDPQPVQLFERIRFKFVF